MRPRWRRSAGHGEFDASGIAFDIAVQERDVSLLDFALSELFDELQMGLVGERNDQRAGGSFVEAMDDAGAERAADTGKIS